MTKTAIPPGGEGTIKVTFSSGSKKNALSKSITVTSNDPKKPTSTIRVKAFIEVIFDFEQSSLYLGKVSHAASTTKSSFIMVKDVETTKVLEVTSSSEFVNAKMLDYTDKKNGRYDRMKMEVTTLPGLPLGRINETVTVKTNLKDKPTAVLRLTGSVIGDVEVTPEWMTFVVTDTASTRPSTLTKKIFITNHVKGANLEIVNILDSEDYLNLSLKPLSKGQRYELTATLRPDRIPERGSVTGNVVLTTNFPNQKEVAIRYSAVHKSYNTRGSRKNHANQMTFPPANSSQRDDLPELSVMTDPSGEEGLFATTIDDPFAVFDELPGEEAEANSDAKKNQILTEEKLNSPKESGEEKPPADAGSDGDSDKKEEKEETRP